MRDHTNLRAFALAAIVAAFSSASPAADIAGWPTDPQRGQWLVARTSELGYTAWVVNRVSDARLYLTRSQSAAEQNWADWLLWGSTGTSERMTLIVERSSRRVLHEYDLVNKVIRPAPIGNPTLAIAGKKIAGGSGLTTPWELPALLQADKQTVWIGIRATPVGITNALVPAVFGLKVDNVYPTGAGEMIGLKNGDLIIRIAPWVYNAPILKNADFRKELADRFEAGDELEIEYLRTEDGKKPVLQRNKAIIPGAPGLSKRLAPEIQAFVARWSNEPPHAAKGLLDLLKERNQSAAGTTDLMDRLAALHYTVDAYRMGQIVVAHTCPFQTEAMCRDYLQRLPRPGPRRIEELVTWLDSVYLTRAVQDFKLPETRNATDGGQTNATPTFRPWQGRNLNAHMDYMEDVLREAAACRERAFRNFGKEEIAFLELQAQELLASFMEVKMMSYDHNTERSRRNLRLLNLACKLDREALLQQSLVLAQLTRTDFLDSLRPLLATLKLDDKPGGRNTPWGTIVLAGPGDDRHTADAAILIDIAGDDVYLNNCGGPVSNAIPSALVIDFAGNDRYESWVPFRIGSGAFGVGFLLDLAGDDSYVCMRGGEGAGLFGIGVLADYAGNDRYRAYDYAQGMGQFGAGVLLDDDGDNLFEGHQACQGVGFPWGIGLLYAGGKSGRDYYYCKGNEESGYQDAGSFEGWGQGIGIGHRNFASGGVGWLVDEGGDDLYEGGTFSQGGGYYFGLGILQDRAGNDCYRGSRYNMGFTAHQAAGVFLEDGGNDRYDTFHYVAVGMAWDESVTIFVDRAGDDFYLGRGFAFGASAMNGFTLCIDGDGADRYIGPAPGSCHGNNYHDGASIGYFLDLGKGEDVFPAPRKAGDVVADPAPQTDSAYSFFVDAPTIEAARQQAARPAGK